MAELRVYLVDDHAILREGLRALIDCQPDMCVVGDAPDGGVALLEVSRLQPHVVVMDISMPGLNGAEATRRMRLKYPNVRVLALTAHEEAAYAQLLVDAGASGYLLKRAAAADLIGAIRALAAGEIYLDVTVAQEIHPQPAPPKELAGGDLSERETEVLRMIAFGFSMKHMAEVLGLSPRTLETYKIRGMAKLQLENRSDIVRFALQQGWLKDA